MLDATKFYVDGSWIAPISDALRDVQNPSTEEVFAQITLGSAIDVDLAVAAARAAFPVWSKTPKADRIALLGRVVSAYEARSEDLAQAISCEMGAPIALARTDQVSAGLRHLKAAIEVLRDFRFEEPLANETCGHRILREPIGVCALITPWNWPMNQVALKVAPALAAGCTVVLKPSEVAPVSAYIFAEILEEAGIPAGVFNIVNGDGPVVGAHLSRHPVSVVL
jgi:aldehyde dehydrogenase (NAD+)